MNTFELQTKINANRALDFADKAILNQIISYINNNKTFHATNEYLAECWGTNLTAIKRAIRTLKSIGLIVVTNKRSKHQQGDKAWYNKRYIQVDLEALEAFLSGQTANVSTATPFAPQIKPIECEIEQLIETNDDEPVLGVFPEQDNVYTRLMAEKEGRTSEHTAYEYDHESVLELISYDDTLSQTVKRRKNEGKNIDEDYTSGVFTYIIQKSERYKEQYRAIKSKKHLAYVA